MRNRSKDKQQVSFIFNNHPEVIKFEKENEGKLKTDKDYCRYDYKISQLKEDLYFSMKLGLSYPDEFEQYKKKEFKKKSERIVKSMLERGVIPDHSISKCPYNSKHIVKYDVVWEHIKTCPDGVGRENEKLYVCLNNEKFIMCGNEEIFEHLVCCSYCRNDHDRKNPHNKINITSKIIDKVRLSLMLKKDFDKELEDERPCMMNLVNNDNARYFHKLKKMRETPEYKEDILNIKNMIKNSETRRRRDYDNVDIFGRREISSLNSISDLEASSHLNTRINDSNYITKEVEELSTRYNTMLNSDIGHNNNTTTNNITLNTNTNTNLIYDNNNNHSNHNQNNNVSNTDDNKSELVFDMNIDFNIDEDKSYNNIADNSKNNIEDVSKDNKTNEEDILDRAIIDISFQQNDNDTVNNDSINTDINNNDKLGDLVEDKINPKANYKELSNTAVYLDSDSSYKSDYTSKEKSMNRLLPMLINPDIFRFNFLSKKENNVNFISSNNNSSYNDTCNNKLSNTGNIHCNNDFLDNKSNENKYGYKLSLDIKTFLKPNGSDFNDYDDNFVLYVCYNVNKQEIVKLIFNYCKDDKETDY